MDLLPSDAFSGPAAGTWPITGEYFTFGRFQLFPERRTLFSVVRSPHEPVHLNSRAMDILIALVREAGDVVSKRELLEHVWPDTIVDESNLRVQVAALRRVLDDHAGSPRFIEGVSGRGYRFVAECRRGRAGAAASVQAPGRPPVAKLPTLITPLVGRKKEILDLHELFAAGRFLSIVGPGGIGKTTLALAFGNEIAPSLADGVVFIDLSSVSGPDSVAEVVATSLGIAVRSGNAVEQIVESVNDKSLLLIIDCCEHVIDAAAAFVETMLRSTGAIRILTTSNEPLRAEGERVYRLGPLGMPESGVGQPLERLLAFPAVELFVDRATAGCGRQCFADSDAPLLARVCRRLEGVPLAIEIAASRFESLGLRGLEAELEGAAYLGIQGRRTAKPQHRTLSNLLDRSYGLLSSTERAVLRRLSVFAGRFRLSAAKALLDDLDTEVGDGIASLVRKSLLIADFDDGEPHYRLLESVRLYAWEKLCEADEASLIRRKHSLYCEAVVSQLNRDWASGLREETLERFCRVFDDLRAAIDREMTSMNGSPDIGDALALAAYPLCLQMTTAGGVGDQEAPDPDFARSNLSFLSLIEMASPIAKTVPSEGPASTLRRRPKGLVRSRVCFSREKSSGDRFAVRPLRIAQESPD